MRRHRGPVYPGLEHLPVGIALRGPVLAAAVEDIAARIARERMPKQLAGARASRNDHGLDDLEVLLGLLLRPVGGAFGQALQAERRAAAVAGHAPRMALALLEEERLHARLVEVVIERRGRRRRRRLLSKQCR